MAVLMVAKTEFIPPPAKTVENWECDVDGGQALIEFAGRECYQSWDKPNPKTRTNFDYITKSILSHQHFSVLEHATVSFRFTKIPRSLTHEFIRHRHFSYSELSQRYVDMTNVPLIEHPLIRDLTGDHATHAKAIMRASKQSVQADYEDLSEILTEAGHKGKKVRQAARSALPEATETRIVVTGNLRAWRHFIDLRATVQADTAIRETAIDTLRLLEAEFPAVFHDYEIRVLETGETVAEGKYRELS